MNTSPLDSALVIDRRAIAIEEYTGKRAPNTVRRYRSVVKDFTAVIGNKPIRSITAEEIYDWAAARMERVGVRTINSVDLTAIRSMFSYANSIASKRFLKTNPAVAQRLP